MVDIRCIVAHDVLTFETDGYAMPVYECSNILIRYCLEPAARNIFTVVALSHRHCY